MFTGELYCASCHTRLFGPKGYGYGVGSGVLSTDTGKAGETVSTAPKTAPINSGLLGQGKLCPRCSQVVYDAEKVRAVGKVSATRGWVSVQYGTQFWLLYRGSSLNYDILPLITSLFVNVWK